MLSKIAVTIRSLSPIRKSVAFRRILKIVSNMVAKIIYGKYKQVSIAKKYKFLLNSDFAFSDYENWGSGHNKGFIKLLNVSKDKRVIFDIGAHIGLCTLPLSSIAQRIISFEASPVNGKYLNDHLRVNSIHNVDVIPCLIGEKSKECVRFYDVKGGSGIPSIANLRLLNKDVKIANVDIKQISLDQFVGENSIIPDVIKIDVEGAEFNVLDGASTILKQYRPDIIISLHPRHLQSLQRDIAEVFDYCTKYSYRLLSCVDGHTILVEELGLDEYYMQPIS